MTLINTEIQKSNHLHPQMVSSEGKRSSSETTTQKIARTIRTISTLVKAILTSFNQSPIEFAFKAAPIIEKKKKGKAEKLVRTIIKNSLKSPKIVHEEESIKFISAGSCSRSPEMIHSTKLYGNPEDSPIALQQKYDEWYSECICEITEQLRDLMSSHSAPDANLKSPKIVHEEESIKFISAGSCLRSTEMIHSTKLYGNPEDSPIALQQKYDEWYSECICEIAEQLRDLMSSHSAPDAKMSSYLFPLLEDLGKKRRAYAVKVGAVGGNDSYSFGVMRCDGRAEMLETRLDAPRYRKYLYRAMFLLGLGDEIEGETADSLKQRQLGSLENHRQSEVKMDACGDFDIKSPEDPLRAPLVWISRVKRENKSPVFNICNGQISKRIGKERISELESRLSTILTDVKEVDFDEFLRQLAPIHWTLSRLSLFYRGSAACTEILIQGICKAKGYPLPRLSGFDGKYMIYMDLEAMLTPFHEFTQRYPEIIHQLSAQ